MSEKIDLDGLLFSPEAAATISNLGERLTIFSQISGANQEPEIWGELGNNGVLIVKIIAKTGSGGEVKMDLEIPVGHWSYAQ